LYASQFTRSCIVAAQHQQQNTNKGITAKHIPLIAFVA
jgi:hypothetical protein